MPLLQEFRFAARMLLRTKAWTAVALLVLALGLGANTSFFSVVGLMIWLPLPYRNSEELAIIQQSNVRRNIDDSGVSLPDVRDWAAGSTIASIAAYRSRPMGISGQGEPQPLFAMQVSPEFFPTLGATPFLGRTFTSGESPETESRTVVISYELWQGLFRGDRTVLGRDVRLDGRNYSIVGVMPEAFHFAYWPCDVWIPLWLEPRDRERGAFGLSTIARLKPGLTVEQASAEIRAISERSEREYPAAGLGWRGRVRPFTYLMVDSGAQAAAGTMFGATGFVLLIACANVASLVLARGTGRQRELAIRASLGATRGSLIRLQLVEGVLLGLAGGALGVILAYWNIPLLKRIAPAQMTFFRSAHLDWNALGFSLALSLIAGVLAGLIPAWRLTRGDLSSWLQDSSRGSSGGRHTLLKGLVTAEIALALVLVACGTSMVRSLIRRTTIDPGFDRTNLVTGRVLLSSARHATDRQMVDFYSQALENLRRDQAVESAAAANTIPLAGGGDYQRVRVDGQADAEQERFAGDMVVSPGYFRAMRIPILAGREFTHADDVNAAPAGIVNETFVKRFWPKETTILGRRVQIDGAWVTVVGVARDVRHRNVFRPARAEVYRPHAQHAVRNMMLVARGRGGTEAAIAALRSAVTQVDRDQPVFRLLSLQALLDYRAAGQRATATALGWMAALALVLAAVGAYGVMSYTAARRVREIGIRLTLGATRPGIFRLVLQSAAALTAIALLIGLPGAYGANWLVRAVDPGVEAGDTGTYLTATLLLVFVSLAAAIVPAWRSVRVDPAQVLRSE